MGNAAVEPFVIRCETCHARLRVRDERVLGQIHECPRCGSMVQIVAPAAMASPSMSAAASGESMIFPAVKPATEVPAVELPMAAPPVVATAAAKWPLVAVWSSGGAALFLLGGIVGALVLSGGADEPQIVAEAVPPVPAGAAAPKRIEDDIRESPPVSQTEEQVAEASPPVEPVVAQTADEVVAEPVAPAVVSTPAPAPTVVAAPKPERTLTLEPVEPSASEGELADLLATPSYEATVELEEAQAQVEDPPGRAGFRPGGAAGVPERVTNVGDQLAVRVVEIDMPGMSLASFVEMISEMAAVPISLDAAALEAAGVSPRTKVTVRARNETLESLLTKALAAHGLAWEEHEGQLSVVRADTSTTGEVAPAAGR